MSVHARTRMQQPGIAGEVLAALLDYGHEHYDHAGRVVVFFDKAARQRLARETGAVANKDLERLTRTYAVVTTSGAVISVGHRYRRIPRD